MKKFVKPLVIASSVAAVVGIGAVSFAAWAGATTEDVEKTGTTGVIDTIGELTVTSADVTKALYPVDQGTNSTAAVPADGVIYWTFTLSVPDATGSVTPVYSLKAELTKGDTDLGDAALYYSKDAPTSATGAVAANLLDKDTAKELTLNAANEDGESTVYVYLVAEDTDAMNASVKLTFSVAAE